VRQVASVAAFKWTSPSGCAKLPYNCRSLLLGAWHMARKTKTKSQTPFKSAATSKSGDAARSDLGVALLTAQRPGTVDEIIQIAANSKIARYYWLPNRGVAPPGYIKGMALVYARIYCKFKAGNVATIEMAKPDTNNPARDVLSWYAPQFAEVGMSNAAAGVDTLRHLFVLMVGLGMQESAGRYCDGRDTSEHNITADTAEAGLFQTSYDVHTVSPLLPSLFKSYSANPSGFLEIFKEGVTVKPGDLDNYGSGPGCDFQKLEKDCPAFAAEFAAVALRHRRDHWGTINGNAVELKADCETMLLAVQNAVDTSPELCALLQ
jgi:hypothetical protein